MPSNALYCLLRLSQNSKMIGDCLTHKTITHNIFDLKTNI
jgi:hypothetical protein